LRACQGKKFYDSEIRYILKEARAAATALVQARPMLYKTFTAEAVNSGEAVKR